VLSETIPEEAREGTADMVDELLPPGAVTTEADRDQGSHDTLA
jgi:hypothetical protein